MVDWLTAAFSGARDGEQAAGIMLKSRFFRSYLLPGFIFQSVVIAGGYGTGRELVEFFLSYGTIGGLVSMLLVTTVLWSLVCAATFEFARHFQVFDYRHFFKVLLGRGWVVFELCYLGLLLIVLAVIASAAGSILQDTVGLPYQIGVLAMILATGGLIVLGSDAIERFHSVWSFVLYAVYVALIILCLIAFGPQIRQGLAQGSLKEGWAIGGVQYAAYNLGVIPAVLYSIRHCRTRRQAVGAGLLAGPIAMIPGVFFTLAMAGQYPGILREQVPADFLLGVIGSPLFQATFHLVLFGTLIETSTGMIHAVTQRVSAWYSERGGIVPGALRPGLAMGILLVAAATAQFGLVGLIAKGYGTITWGFLAVYVIPILTLGVWRLVRGAKPVSAP